MALDNVVIASVLPSTSNRGGWVERELPRFSDGLGLAVVALIWVKLRHFLERLRVERVSVQLAILSGILSAVAILALVLGAGCRNLDR